MKTYALLISGKDESVKEYLRTFLAEFPSEIEITAQGRDGNVFHATFATPHTVSLERLCELSDTIHGVDGIGLIV